MPPRTSLVVLAFAAVYLIWGSTYLAIRYAVESLPPFLMAGTRYLLAGLPLLLWLRWHRPEPIRRVHWRSALILGALMMFGGNGLVSWAEQRVPSSVAAVLIATLSLWMTLLDRLLYRGPRLRAVSAAGLILGFGGVAWLMAPRGDELGRIDPVGGGILILAAFLWANGSLLSRRVPQPASPFLAVALQMIAGGGVLLAVGTAQGEWARVDPARIDLRAVAAVLYLVVFGSVVALSAFIWLLRVRSAAAVATYAFVNPVVALLLGGLVGGESLGARTLAASGVIVVAVALLLLASRTRPRPRPAAPAGPSLPDRG